MKKAIKVIISGTVQGVFFRSFIKENADRLEVRGFCRNLENGRVECYFEGDNESIEKILDIVRQGPPHSMIKNVELEDAKFTGDYKEFKILRI